MVMGDGTRNSQTYSQEGKTMMNRTAIFRDPVFRSLASFANEIDRACSMPARAVVRGGAPAINILGTENELIIEAEVPGLTLDDIEIVLNADELTIRGERRSTTTENRTMLRQERPSGSFERSFTLPAEIDSEHAAASLEHGVLTISLPKSKASRPRRIEISGNRTAPQQLAEQAQPNENGNASA